MSSSMSKAAGVIALCLLGAGGAAAAPLFEPVTVLSRAGTANQPALQALMGSPSTSAVQEVRVDAAAVSPVQKQLEFELLGQPVQALQSKVETLADGGSIWYGQIGTRAGARLIKAGAPDPMNAVILVRSGNTVTGSIRKDGQL